MSKFFYVITIIPIILLLCLFCYYIVCLPFDYCGNLTTAQPVVKVCAADSQAIPSLYDLSVSLVKVLAELSFHQVRLASGFMSTQGFGGR